MSILEIADDQFDQEVLKANLPVLVDFYGTWCAPCKKLLPIIEELSSEYEGKVKFVKININDNQQTPTQFQVFAVPNLMFFKDGNRIDGFPSLVPKEKIKEKLDAILA